MSAVELFLAYPFLQRALVAALVVAVLCSVLGVFVVLRNLSMLGDGLAHISFAGVALGLVVGVYPLGLALVFAVLGALVIEALRARGVVPGDAAIGILFTAGLSIGVIVVSFGRGLNVDVLQFLFGNLLAVTTRDLAVVAGLAVLLLLALALLGKEFFYVTFQEEAARISGLPVAALNVLFTTLTAASIVVAARVVGILLVSALVVVPAASSLQFARSFRGALALSVGFGTLSVLLGVYSAAEWGLATGASIALASTLLFAGGLLVRRAVPRLGPSGRRAGTGR